jgi:hypothetical protein
MPEIFEKPFIVVFDLDECLGSFLFGCLSYHKLQHLFSIKDFPMDEFDIVMEDSLNNCWLRPGIIHILKTCVYYRHKKLIKHICLYTNSTNEYNWVSYLIKCLYNIVGIHNIFDLVITRESPGRTQVPMYEYMKYGGCQPKFVDDVIRLTNSELDTPVLFYDDRVFNIVPSKLGKCVCHIVSPFERKQYYYEDHESFIEFIEEYMPDMQEYFESKLEEYPILEGYDTKRLTNSNIQDNFMNLIFARNTLTEFLPPLMVNVINLIGSSGNPSESPQSLQDRVTESITEHLQLLQ